MSNNLYKIMRGEADLKYKVFREKHGGLRMDYIKKISFQLLQSFCYLKSQNIIHCDIKPENIMTRMNEPDNIRLIDFGSSCNCY